MKNLWNLQASSFPIDIVLDIPEQGSAAADDQWLRFDKNRIDTLNTKLAILT
jgi:hypothetical protein